MFSKYKKFIDKYISLNQIEWTLFKSKVKIYHHKKGERFGRLMAEMAYSHTNHATIDRLTKTAKERFDDLINEAPYLLEKVPQYHIATYLGITPQSLSRLKN